MQSYSWICLNSGSMRFYVVRIVIRTKKPHHVILMWLFLAGLLLHFFVIAITEKRFEKLRTLLSVLLQFRQSMVRPSILGAVCIGHCSVSAG